MKKILVSLLFMVAAAASFAQIDSVNYPARKMPFGNWDFIWTNGTLTDTVKVYPEKGGIGLDTLFFGDTKQWTAWQPGSSDTGYVKTTGDTIYGDYYFGSTDGLLNDNELYLFNDNGEIDLYINDTCGGVLTLASSVYTSELYPTKLSIVKLGDGDYSIVYDNNISIYNSDYYIRKLDATGGNVNGRFIKFTDSDSSTTIYNKLIVESPNDTAVSIRGGGMNDVFCILKNGKTYIGDSSSTTDAILVVDPTDSTSTFIGTVSVEKSLQVGDDATAASAANVGAIRYRSDANNSYCEMVMKTGASTYAWVVVKQYTW